MLPPILPLSVVPVTSQQDPVRPRPETLRWCLPRPVLGTVRSTSNTMMLDQAALRLREEQQRR